MQEVLELLRPTSTRTKSNLEASAPGRLPGRFSTITNPLQKEFIMPSFLIMDGNGNKKEFDLSQIKSKNDVAQAFKEFNQEAKEKKNREEK